MNICPGCEAEMETGLELCANCAGEPVNGDLQDGTGASFASLEFADGVRFDLGSRETMLGRSDPVDQVEPDVDLSFHGGFEQGVSRRHAIIALRENGYTLEDLGSTNGTFHNREKVIPGSPVTLVEGDVIYLGKMKAVFHVGADEGGAS